MRDGNHFAELLETVHEFELLGEFGAVETKVTEKVN